MLTGALILTHEKCHLLIKMSPMCRPHLTLRNFQRVVYVSSLLSLLTFFTWAYRPERLFQSLTVPTRLPPGCGPGQLDREKIPLVAVNGTKTLLVSAYQELRTATREIRVIAVVMRSETATYQCILCCQGQRHVSTGHSSVHRDHFGFDYGTADIMCPLPSDCETASHVAVAVASGAVGVASGAVGVANRAVGVVSGAEKAEEEPAVFLEVSNQQPRSDSFPHNFTVCFSTMFDFTNVLQLVQSLEMLRLLGVTRVVVYKTSCSPDTQRLLDHYTHTGLVEVIPWRISSLLKVSRGWLPSLSPGQMHYYGQIPVLNDCVYRTMYQTQYLAMHDVDELILPQTVNSWGDLMPLLEQQHGSEYFGFMFENNVFPVYNTAASKLRPSSVPHTAADNKAGQWRGVAGVNILDHLYHEPNDPTTLTNFKVIVNPRAVFSTTVHGLLDPETGCVQVDRTMARMYHTRSPWQPGLTPDQLIFDGRLLDFSLPLISAVDAVLKETGLIT